MTPTPVTVRTEFASRWPLLRGAWLGIGVGIIGLPSPAIGLERKISNFYPTPISDRYQESSRRYWKPWTAWPILDA
jgi:hypothetical protein